VSERDDTKDGMDPRENDAWLARPSTIRLLWQVFALVLAGSIPA
jgi:hypothetical protein